MATEIVMPRLSDTMSEGTVGKWLKREGEQVEKGEILAEIETDKATMELESFHSGVLGRILIPEGKTVPIGVPIAILVAPGEEVSSEAAVLSPTALATAEQVSAGLAPPGTLPIEPHAAPPLAPQERGDGRVRVSPLARRLAEERGIDLRQVEATGPGGRITREDVEAFLQRPRAPEVSPQPAPTAFPGPAEEEELVPLSTMQQTIVRRMLESKAAAPHFYVTSDIDMSEAVAFRRSLNAALGEGQHVTFNDLVVKAVAMALRSFPAANASYREGQFVRHQAIHVGVAVAIPDGLVVPVIRNTDRKTLGEIARESRELADKARNRRLTLQEMEVSTFSITNLGMYDVDQFTGIINLPNAAILGVGSITRKPVVKDEQIVISDRMRVTLSVDHRVLYGAEAAQFLREVKRILEHPSLLAY